MPEADEAAGGREVRQEPPPPLRNGNRILFRDACEGRVGELELVHREVAEQHRVAEFDDAMAWCMAARAQDSDAGERLCSILDQFEAPRGIQRNDVVAYVWLVERRRR
jgi:hypothetical protein